MVSGTSAGGGFRRLSFRPRRLAGPATPSPVATASRSPRLAGHARAFGRVRQALFCAAAFLALAGSGVLVAPGAALAQTMVADDWALKPSGLGAGDQFRLIFLSSTTHNAVPTAIGDYNTFVQNLAAAGHSDIQSYSSGFKVVGCTPDDDARDNTLTTYTSSDMGVPIYWLNGNKAVDHYEDFYDGSWDDEENPKDESGNNRTVSGNIFTGCNHDGTEATFNTASRGLGSTSSVRFGRLNAAGFGPIGSTSGTNGTNSHPFYGLSEVFQVSGGTTTSSGVTVSEPSLTVTEEDTTGDTYSVVLDSAPTASVTIAIGGHSGTDVTPAPASLAFTTTNWSSPQTVTVTAGDDTDTTDDSVTLEHTATSTDSDYSGIAIDDVSVTVEDNDTAQVTGLGLTAGNAQLMVYWTAVSNATGYQVQWKSGSQNYNNARRALIDSGTTASYTITSLANGTEYTVRVRATRMGYNNGAHSTEVKATPALDPMTAYLQTCIPYGAVGCLDHQNIAEDTGTVVVPLVIDIPESWLNNPEWAQSEVTGTLNVRVETLGAGEHTNATATEGDDYTAVAKTLDLTYSDFGLQGVAQVTVDVPITHDAHVETDETIAPAITGVPQVGQTLTADTSGIVDADGVPSSFSFQWVRVDASDNETNVGTDSETYDPVAADVGSSLRVDVSFTDDAGNAEGPLSSDATAAVVAAPEDCVADRPGHDWCTLMTVGSARLGSGTNYGFHAADNLGGSLDDGAIDHGPISKEVDGIWIRDLDSGTDRVVIDFEAGRLPHGTVFDFGGSAFTADAASEHPTEDTRYRWDRPSGFAWLDGQKVTVSANLPPNVTEATVNGTLLVLTYIEDLDTGSTPAATAYTVTVAGTDVTPSGVTVAARTVTLTLAAAVTAGQTVTVSYTVPADNPVQDESGVDAPALDDHPVMNNTGVTTNNPPTLANAIEDRPARVGEVFSYTFPANTFNDADGDTLSYAAAKGDDSTLPTWLSFNADSRTFSGTPADGDVGTVTVKVTASDGRGGSASDEFVVTVRAAATGTLVLTIERVDEEVTEGQRARFRIHTSERTRGWLKYGVEYEHEGEFLRATSSLASTQGWLRTRKDKLYVTVGPATVDDGTVEADGSVTMRLVEGEGYTVGSPSSATVRIRDNDSGGAATGAAVSVADVKVREGPGAVLPFVVRLDRALSATATVNWTTLDGSGRRGARAGSDYVAGSGTLTFRPGDTSKRVDVQVLDDAHDEDDETMLLLLSRPSGVAMDNDGAVAKGVIENTDAMPQAWLGRFGRTVAGQVLDAVEERMRAAPRPGAQVTLAGQRLGGGAPDAEALAEAEEKARLEDLSTWLRGEACRDASGAGADCPAGTLGVSREVTGRDLLGGSSFALSGGSPEGGFATLWGRGALTRFDGRAGELSLSGEVTGALLGTDWARERWSAGLVLSHARGEGRYQASSRSERNREGADGGEVTSTLIGLYPWGRYAMSDRVTVWGAAGYGSGKLTLTPENDERYETDMDLAMAAAGLRGVVVEAPAEGGPELAVKTDALAVRTSSDATQGAGGNLAAATGDVTRLRLGLEGTWRGLVLGTGTLEPRLEVGARHDGGDAETGFGLDLGAGLAWSDPASGVHAEASGRGLLTHESSGFGQRGFAGRLGFDPRPGTDRGPSLTLTQSVGLAASGGADALLGRRTLGGLSANDDGEELENRRFEMKLGYGFAVFGDRFTSTPQARLGWSESARETVLGWRLAEERRSGIVFGLDVEGARREPADGGGEPAHRLGLGLGWRLEGAADTAFEVRFEGARVEAANDDDGPEHRLGLRMTARW